jgi:hypothetical protein
MAHARVASQAGLEDNTSNSKRAKTTLDTDTDTVTESVTVTDCDSDAVRMDDSKRTTEDVFTDLKLVYPGAAELELPRYVHVYLATSPHSSPQLLSSLQHPSSTPLLSSPLLTSFPPLSPQIHFHE